jgi:hypothetical protein
MAQKQDKKSTDKLHAFADSELDTGEKQRFQAHLLDSPEDRLRVEAIREIGLLVRAHMDNVLSSVAFTDLWPSIDSALSKDELEESELNPLMLQAFADGQLSGGDLSHTSSAVAHSPKDRERVSVIAEMGDLVREVSEQEIAQADFSQLWSGLETEWDRDQSISKVKEVAPQLSTASFMGQLLNAIGGYRSVFMSAVTAAAVVLFLLPMINKNAESEVDNNPQQLEIRVVHINEVRSDPGYNVTVDSFNGTAPVIYIRPQEEPIDTTDAGNENDEPVFNNPI